MADCSLRYERPAFRFALRVIPHVHLWMHPGYETFVPRAVRTPRPVRSRSRRLAATGQGTSLNQSITPTS